MTHETPNDPMDFLKNMWGNMGFSLPGMVTPTVDTDELGKRIADLKAVEGWLKSNLGLLQMTIQGLEMQRTTLLALQQMSQAVQEGEGGPAPNPFLNPASWPMPWNLAGGTSDMTPAEPAAPPKEESAPKAPAKRTSSAQKNKPKR